MVIEREEILRRLERAVQMYGTLTRAAEQYGISPTYLSAVLRGERNIGHKLLRVLKIRRTVVKTILYEVGDAKS